MFIRNGALAFLILIALSSLSCRSGSELADSGLHFSSTVRSEGASYTIGLARTTFGFREKIYGTFEVRNETSRERTFHFPCAQQFGFVLSSGFQDTVMLYPSMFENMWSELTLKSGEVKTYKFNVPFRDTKEQLLPSGTYILRAFLLEKGAPPVLVPITIQPFPPTEIMFQ